MRRIDKRLAALEQAAQARAPRLGRFTAELTLMYATPAEQVYGKPLAGQR